MELKIQRATGFWSRFKGLMLTAGLQPDRALLITRCPSVHTCFMRYALDLAYLDERGHVVKLVRGVKPWRMSLGGRSAAHVLELAAGGIERLDIRIGDRIDLQASRQSINNNDSRRNRHEPPST
jgi:uncharacterized membrane protein (UPF0127 family)